MFTGIISDIGDIERLEDRGDLRARIRATFDPDTMLQGASIACDGICLTVVDFGPSDTGCWFDVDISAETLSKTNVRSSPSEWKPGRALNLERALRLGDELGGHIVSGHVDGRAEILSLSSQGDSTRMVFRTPDALARFIAPKGSVALNGTSLTVNDVEGSSFAINFIPHTKTHTTWGAARPGDLANLEIDTLARYVARLNEFSAA
jgi:riboflavin synthase